ncbi:MAG: hypothetical protein U0M06_09645 [Clostridia bacterium]|nr:hypothetical protein [Clostridia bacterium]
MAVTKNKDEELKVKPMPTAPTYDSSTWDESQKGNAALGAYDTAKNAVNNYGDFVFSQNDWLNSIKDSIKNYGEFNYDVNSDALYQQYADQYVRQGKLASADVMGQAAAMTGGYGNSYASSAGNQAFQSYLQQLNDRVPELYQLALDRHNMGKEDLYNQYGMLMNEYEREYGLHSDEYNKLLDSLGIAKDDYYSGADMFYTEQGNKNSALGQEYSDAMAIWEADTNNYWNQKNYDLQDRQVTLQEQTYADNKAAADDNKKLYSGTNSTGGNYNNGTLTKAQVKALQAALGVTADGYYGAKSQKAAGGLSAAEAYAKYVGGADNNPTTSGVTDEIRKKAAGFNNNASLASYLDGLVANGIISETDSDSLYAEYVDQNEKYVTNKDGSTSISYKNMINSTNGWSVINDGGGNFVGVDNDAIVEAPNGEKIRLDDLVGLLKKEGMSNDAANNAVKKLQKSLGISVNWFFGL